MPHARCSRCEARRTLSKKPDEYVRPPPCRKCGSRRYRLDKYRQKFERGRRAPKCDPARTGCRGYSFIHRRGSGFCDHNPKLTLEDLQARERWA